MKIHEYQAKDILRKYGVPVPDGEMATTLEEADTAAKTLFGKGNAASSSRRRFMPADGARAAA